MDTNNLDDSDEEVEPQADEEMGSKIDDEVEPQAAEQVEPLADKQVEPQAEEEMESKIDELVKPLADKQMEPRADEELELKTGEGVETAANEEADEQIKLHDNSDEEMEPQADITDAINEVDSLMAETDEAIEPEKVDSAEKHSPETNSAENEVLGSEPTIHESPADDFLQTDLPNEDSEDEVNSHVISDLEYHDDSFSSSEEDVIPHSNESIGNEEPNGGVGNEEPIENGLNEVLNESIVYHKHDSDNTEDSSARQEMEVTDCELAADLETSIEEENVDEVPEKSEADEAGQEIAGFLQEDAETESGKVSELEEQDHEMPEDVPSPEGIPISSAEKNSEPTEKPDEMSQKTSFSDETEKMVGGDVDDVATPVVDNVDLDLGHQNEKPAEIENSEEINIDDANKEDDKGPETPAPRSKSLTRADDLVIREAELYLAGSPKPVEEVQTEEKNRSRSKKRSSRVLKSPPKGSRKSTRSKTVPRSYGNAATNLPSTTNTNMLTQDAVAKVVTSSSIVNETEMNAANPKEPEKEVIF